MKILPIMYKYHEQKNAGVIKNNPVTPPMQNFSTREISSLYYKPNAPLFKGTWFEDNIVKNVEGKQYQGAGLYGGSRNRYLDFSKIGSEYLSQEPLDITKASDDEVYAYWQANSLREAYETSWVRRYNPFNKTKPLAIPHALGFRENNDFFANNLKILGDKNRGWSLDKPITDEKGKLNIDCTVFDTETTGVNIMGGNPKNWDKIIQIGALQVKGGKVIEDSAYNQLINPEVHIPEGATAVHGISDDMVADKPTMAKVLSPFLNNYLNKQNGVIVAYNSKFDITLLNNAIREHNSYSNKDLKQRQAYKVLDPYLLMLRIHPYLGARKRLSEQYQFLFSKNMENAHDAFADVKGTVDVLKYTLYYLDAHRKDKSKPLTIRDVLIFQNGGKVPNIDIPLDIEGCSTLSNFRKSYVRVSTSVTNYFQGYQLTANAFKEIIPQIGDVNAQKLIENRIVNQVVELKSNGLPVNPAETKRTPDNKGFENAFYTLERNYKKVLEFADLEPYKDLSKDEVENIILQKAELYSGEIAKDIWMKNPNPKDIAEGNDLPDLEIARKVMIESRELNNYFD